METPLILGPLLRRAVPSGTLLVVDAGGRAHSFGDGGAPHGRARLHDRAVERELLLHPDLALGEAGTEGRVSLDEGDLAELLDLVTRGGSPRSRWRHAWATHTRRLRQANSRRRARANAAFHYDLDERLFRLFLDGDLQYSCAYWEGDHDDLDLAQQAKKRLVARKLCLEPGQRVLDVGAGWGGLALHLAAEHGVEVLGISLSAEQVRVATRRASGQQSVRFELRDFRDLGGTFDRVVSVGMLEHVGAPWFDAFFGHLRDRLAPDGVALVHSVARMEPPGFTNPWLERYIFPGSYIPAISEVVSSVERMGLWVTDLEILRLHYARTMRAWRRRFLANREAVRRLTDERFCRMWDFYLASSEVAYHNLNLMVVQLQLARDQRAVPLTRDYLWR